MVKGLYKGVSYGEANVQEIPQRSNWANPQIYTGKAQKAFPRSVSVIRYVNVDIRSLQPNAPIIFN